MIDTHIHTEYSSDSQMKIQDALERVKKSGIGMTITEHLDLKFPSGSDFTFDIDKYFNDYDKYKNSKFMLGVEIGI
jgi:histidinol-phosphatase (PHP family)